ncbi:hypothetical protein Mrose_02416 [Calidithermus roseus]|uniref:Uncharacterized protein n=1 Tax=Calidithermus roseus TaxID=1644118 RepID=A0A399ELW4_9DEIN|nr:hypothetical protein Mrose_02416 [Calidithermus roseus]
MRPALRERALRGRLETHSSPRSGVEHAERQAREAERRKALRSQARLLALTEAQRQSPKRDQAQALQAEAYQLLSLGSPLRGYSRLKQAGTLLQGLPEADPSGPTSLEPFLDAVLARMGHAPRGHDLEVARTLLHLAMEVGLHRAYHPATGEVVFHLPQGALALALWPEVKPETGRKRVQRALARLSEAGLLAFAPRVGNARDRQTGKPLGWKDGTVFRVRLSPGRARPLTREELAHPWRDLEADTRRGRTLLKVRRGQQNPEVSQSLKHPEGVPPAELLKDWALPPAVLPQTPLSDWDTPASRCTGSPRPERGSSVSRRAAARNALQDVKLCAREERRAFVGEAGTALARLLSDGQSAGLYRALLWGALRRLDRGEDRFEALWNALDRVLTDLEEGFARKPGALLVARLREGGLWAELVEGAPYRVA